MANKYFITIILSIMALSIAACSGCSSRCNEAREKALVAAQKLIQTDHSDTVELQRQILETKSIQSEYAILGDSDAVKAFDESFKEYISEHDKSLAQEMF